MKKMLRIQVKEFFIHSSLTKSLLPGYEQRAQWELVAIFP